jgi:hypothetical protein
MTILKSNGNGLKGIADDLFVASDMHDPNHWGLAGCCVVSLDSVLMRSLVETPLV